jgi:hypothetical protein
MRTRVEHRELDAQSVARLRHHPPQLPPAQHAHAPPVHVFFFLSCCGVVGGRGFNQSYCGGGQRDRRARIIGVLVLLVLLLVSSSRWSKRLPADWMGGYCWAGPFPPTGRRRRSRVENIDRSSSIDAPATVFETIRVPSIRLRCDGQNAAPPQSEAAILGGGGLGSPNEIEVGGMGHGPGILLLYAAITSSISIAFDIDLIHFGLLLFYIHVMVFVLGRSIITWPQGQDRPQPRVARRRQEDQRRTNPQHHGALHRAHVPFQPQRAQVHGNDEGVEEEACLIHHGGPRGLGEEARAEIGHGAGVDSEGCLELFRGGWWVGGWWWGGEVVVVGWVGWMDGWMDGWVGGWMDGWRGDEFGGGVVGGVLRATQPSTRSSTNNQQPTTTTTHQHERQQERVPPDPGEARDAQAPSREEEGPRQHAFAATITTTTTKRRMRAVRVVAPFSGGGGGREGEEGSSLFVSILIGASGGGEEEEAEGRAARCDAGHESGKHEAEVKVGDGGAAGGFEGGGPEEDPGEEGGCVWLCLCLFCVVGGGVFGVCGCVCVVEREREGECVYVGLHVMFVLPSLPVPSPPLLQIPPNQNSYAPSKNTCVSPSHSTSRRPAPNTAKPSLAASHTTSNPSPFPFPSPCCPPKFSVRHTRGMRTSKPLAATAHRSKGARYDPPDSPTAALAAHPAVMAVAPRRQTWREKVLASNMGGKWCWACSATIQLSKAVASRAEAAPERRRPAARAGRVGMWRRREDACVSCRVVCVCVKE